MDHLTPDTSNCSGSVSANYMSPEAEDFAIIQSVSTGMIHSDLITMLSSLVITRAYMEPRKRAVSENSADAVIHVTLSNEHGHLETCLWVKWKELAPLMFQVMSQRNWPTETTPDMVRSILSSRACLSGQELAQDTSPKLPPNY